MNASTMNASTHDKWTAMWMSLAAPGAGQLWAGHWSCVLWMSAAAALAVGWSFVEHGPGHSLGWVVAALSLAWLSARHAKRLFEGDAGDAHRLPGLVSRVSCSPPRGRAVAVRLEIDIPRPPSTVWPFMADAPRFLCIDPFHEKVIPMRAKLGAGVDLAIEHSTFGFKSMRFGRLLRWREGQGYAFSDLSARGRHRGFPHVFFVDLEPLNQGAACRLVIDVRGKWTSPWIPPRMSAWWLCWVAGEHARLLRAAAAAMMTEHDAGNSVEQAPPACEPS